MSLADFDIAVNRSEMLHQAAQAAALATFRAAGGGPSAQAALDASMRTAEVGHFQRKLAAAVANGQPGNELAIQLKSWGQ